MVKKSLADAYELNNGVLIPCVGFGTWQSKNGEMAYQAVTAALSCGYRHIDTAACYGNEESIGQAIVDSDVPREEIFVTSKLWNTERGYEKTLAAFQETMRRLKLEYLDLYLIHWPLARGPKEEWSRVNSDTWRAFEKLYAEGYIRAIGVSNFLGHHLEPLMENAKVMPAVDQIEIHPGYRQQEAVDFCKAHNIVVEAWGPMGTGRLLDNEQLKAIGAKYGKSVAQICIRWDIQHGILPLPKSSNPERIAQNAQVFDFELSDEDMRVIDQMPFCGGLKMHPDEVEF